MNHYLLHNLLLILVLVGSILGCKPADDDLKKKVVYKGPIAETRNIVSQFSDSAKLQIKLMAPLQLQYESGDAIYPDSLFLTFFDKDGKVNNTLRANYGKYEKQKDLYFVRGNVVVHNPTKDETMRTEELFWDKQTRRIYTDKFVTIKTKDEFLQGQGLETNQEFYPMKIKKPTGAFTVQQQPAPPPTSAPPTQ
jgi:LPS export ABC transporter protein LptC